jgi:ATP-binding cassette subfamily B protein/subfamily B ATP-binding cassette protein MsbA
MGGTDLRELQLADLRRHVSVVLQDPFLLPLTAAQNIAYGCPAASRTEIIEAARQAMADEFIRQLPAGYDTPLGEQGSTLSGGQRQRIAIARALLKDAPVLVLDEPSSALDLETEAQILEALDQLVQGRTTFVITHRFSMTRRASRIVVLSEGRIIEQGSHPDLVVQSGLYRELYTRQAATGRCEVAR